MSRSRGTHHRVLDVTDLTDDVFLLRIERDGLEFEPGRYLTLRRPESTTLREYSIYSSPHEDWLAFLIKDVGGDGISTQLHRCRQGDFVVTEGPFGDFIIPEHRRNSRLRFVATGTGIAPFHCFADAYPHLRYQILHGVRRLSQLHGLSAFDPNSHIACLTHRTPGQYHGRVTNYLTQHPQDPSAFYYFCGSADMIFEAFDILQRQGVPRANLFAEIYY